MAERPYFRPDNVQEVLDGRTAHTEAQTTDTTASTVSMDEEPRDGDQ